MVRSGAALTSDLVKPSEILALRSWVDRSLLLLLLLLLLIIIIMIIIMIIVMIIIILIIIVMILIVVRSGAVPTWGEGMSVRQFSFIRVE